MPVNPAIVERAVLAYDLPVRHVLPPQSGYRNQSWPVLLADGRRVNLIIYKREPEVTRLIRNANAVSRLAASQGMAVRQSVDPRILRLRSARPPELGTQDQVRYAALYNYLPGQTIPWEAYSRRHVVLLGAGLSDLHAALAGTGQDFVEELPNVAHVYQAITVRMRRYFNRPDVRGAAQTKLDVSVPAHVFNKYYKLLDYCKKLPSQQPLHMDFVRGNILFLAAHDQLRISGILDFEKTAMGHPLFDIARSLAFLLVDCKNKSPQKVYKYFLYSGYAKRGAAPLPRAPLVRENLVDLFLLHDFYKFLRHNPYESLPQNHHFVRTRDLLRARQVLQ